MLQRFRSLGSGIRVALKGAVNTLLSKLRVLFKHIRADPARQMSKLYRQSPSLNRSASTVVFWVPGGMPLMLHVEGAIAAALRLRGINVHAVICDGPFRACVKREINDGVPVARWQDACAQCRADNAAVLKRMGISYSFIGEFVPESSRAAFWDLTAPVKWETLDDLCYGDINVGKNVRSAILRFLKGYSLTGHEEIVREYSFSALVVAAAAACAMDRIAPSRIFMSHGTYVDWGPALHTALFRGIPVTAWMASYLPVRFYFRHVEDNIRIDFHNMSHAAWEKCESSDLSPAQNARLDKFLEDRYRKHVSFDMKHLKKYSGNIDHLRKEYAPISDKPIWGIMLHVNWDCVSDYSPMAHASFDDWLLDTMREILNIPDVHWLVKVHPAEAWDNPASGALRLIERYFPLLPSHVRVISAEEEISPLNFFELIDGGVAVYGTSGLELAVLGKPVILAGEAHYGGKGFTYDGLTPDAYKQLLREAGSLKPLSEEQRLLARRYAYCYFIQRQIPLSVVRDPKSAWWGFQHDKRHLLLPGRDPFVDFICERILDGDDFIMDEGLVALSERLA